MNLFNLSVNMLRRDWRAGEWRVLLMALMLAVGSIATVGLFADRVRLALHQETSSLLGADLRISSTRPLPSTYRAEALHRGLHAIETKSFPSMVSSKQQNVLAEILAVEEGYPLRGQIQIDDGTTHGSQSIPVQGTLWADTRLMQKIFLQRGDEIGIGVLHLHLQAVVVHDLDQSLGFASFVPRVILNTADLPASGLLQEGSRVNYRLLVAGEAEQVTDFREWLQGRLGVGEKLEDVRDARPEIRISLERAEQFLGLAALTAVVLAGVALALAARHFISHHLNTCAMMRCLGASQSQVLRIFLYQFLLLGACAVLFGEGLGYAVQAVLVQSITSMREAGLPSPGWKPLWQAATTGMALLFGFVFMPLWQLKNVSPLRVIRRELGTPETGTGIVYVTGGVVLCGLFLWQAGSLKLGLTVLGGLASGLLLFGFLAWVALRALSKLGVQAFYNLARHGRSNAVQIVALSLGGMAVLLLTFVRADLMESWHSRLPPDAPNRFILNIQPDQRRPVLDFLAHQQLPLPELFPMVKGRLVAINQHLVKGEDYPDPRARNLAERETNLSWLDHLPKGNELVQGNWFEKGATSKLSLEEGIAKTLGIHVGDTLTYDVAGSQFSATVTNLRKLEWDSMQVNFFVIAPPGMLENFPASYITSFHLPPERMQMTNLLIRNFPNLLMIDTDAMIEQLRHIIDQIAQAMTAVFLFTLLSGMSVLYAALLSTQDERIHHAAILRTLGADSQYLNRLHWTEFATLGILSGLFAAGGAELLGWVLAVRVLDIPYHPGIMIWLFGMGGGMLTVTFAGWLATRHVAKMSPMRVLESV